MRKYLSKHTLIKTVSNSRSDITDRNEPLLVNAIEWQPGAPPPGPAWSLKPTPAPRHTIYKPMGGARRRAKHPALLSSAQLSPPALSVLLSVCVSVCVCVCLCSGLCACLDIAGAGQQHHFMVDVQLEEANRHAFRPEIATNQVASWAKCREGWNAWNICFSCSTSSSGWVERCVWKQRYCYFWISPCVFLCLQPGHLLSFYYRSG